jgi:hypothetical protein
MKEVSIEYAHIYTNNHVGEEQALSLKILGELKNENASLVVLVDDYSFPDPSFDYELFSKWLSEEGFQPDLVFRESQLIPVCDVVLKLLEDETLKNQIIDYIKAKKYPCSLFIAAWYLLRLGHIQSPLFPHSLVTEQLINILPTSFKPFEDKALEIIERTEYKDAVFKIKHRYFDGRLVA